MSDTPFHQTRMGHAFYESTMPALVRELARLNENLERLREVIDGQQSGTSREARPAAREEDAT